jgi:pumilio family protein 6
MLAAFDSVDDTKLLSKAVINEIIGDGKEETGKISEIFASEKAGRKVLLYLLAGRDATYFAPQYLALLKEGDGNEYTKKDDSTRRKELIASAEGGIYKFLSDNLFGLLKADPKCTVFIRAALNCAYASIEKVKPAMERLSDIASDNFVVGEENFVESPAGHQLLKKIIVQDKIRHSEGRDTFSKMLLDQLNAKNSLESYIGCNRGAFLLVTIMETGVASLQQLVKDCLKQYGKTLGAQSTRGAELLVQKLNLHK